MNIPVYNVKGEKKESVEVPAGLFEVVLQPDVVKQVVVAIASNMRGTYAHTKDRSEVRGGGRKPWRQKGTGRARHGSIRSPLWIGGGVTFGPRKNRNWTKKVNKKVRRLALKMMLSEKARHNKLIVIDTFDQKEIKTKQLAATLSALPESGSSTLVLLSEKNDVLCKSASNIPKVVCEYVTNINAGLMMQYNRIVIEAGSLKALVNHFNSTRETN